MHCIMRGTENARLEKTAPNCSGGKHEIGKCGTKTVGVENSDKGMYVQPDVHLYIVLQL